ncbi:hypothetical protein [Mucilaginibacter auburnensis]|uniref:Uncharacterized protein n=1 Tax=Mucilaginibacter auburnensis TaxID=1457233 RepID=A0A2H9VQR6_9SPHI|nr:hypothetical protein [Mucilaginibacter auburnensis]PJJ83187.1 hypothetical protein CLV57_0165 [Mucilaginibacter auburnensis]
MRSSKLPVASIFLVLVFGVKYAVTYFSPERSAQLDPVFTGILEIAIVAFIIYYLRMFVKWAYNYRKAA